MDTAGFTQWRTIDPTGLEPRAAYLLLTSVIVPRPIAWVSTVDGEGTRNLAPHSYCNIVSHDPPVVHFTSTGTKDTLRNVRATGEFVLNVVDVEQLEAMNETAADFPPDIDEFVAADVVALPSELVAPPRVAAAPVALECRVRQELAIGTGTMVFGDVLRVHVAEDVLSGDRVRLTGRGIVGRLAGAAYAEIFDARRLDRPSWDGHRRDTE